MKGKLLCAVVATVIGLVMLSTQSFAQQKTTKECQEEWHARQGLQINQMD